MKFSHLDILKDDDELIYRPSTAVKFIGNPADGRVGGYLVAWGSPDDCDLQGEYFTPDSELGLDWYEQRPVLYHHGLDGELKAAVIGVIDTLKKDPFGLWAEAQLDMRKQYVATVQQLVDKGILAWSSGSVPHLVEITEGHIRRWPIVEGSLTPTPAQPFKTQVSTIKSALAIYRDESAKESPTEEPSDAHKAAGDIPTEPPVTPNNEVKMNLQEMLMQLLAAILSAKPEWQLTPDEQTALVQAVMAQVQPDAAPEAPVEDNAMAAIAQKASPLLLTAIMNYFGEKEASAAKRQQILDDAAKAALAKVPPKSKADFGFSGHELLNKPQAAAQISAKRAEVAAKYADLSAADMSYLAMIDRFNRHQTKSTELGPLIDRENYPFFVEEMAHKAQEAVGKKQLSIDKGALKAINIIAAMKANELDHSTQANFGDEWVPDLWSSDLWRKARLDNVILPLFRTVEMPSNPFELPVEGADPTVYFVPETTQETELTISGSGNPIPDSKIGSGKVQMSAKKLALRVGFSAELEEDSIIPVLSMYREQAERAVMDSIDNVLLNGDTTNTATGNINSDDADPADTEKYLAFNGLRYSALTEDTTRKLDAGGVAPNLALIRATRFKMLAAYAQRPNDIVYLVGGETFAKLLNLDEFLTMDKIGSEATILNGMIGKIDGSPVLTSAEYGLTEADGKKSATPSNNTLGQLAAVYRPNWYVGYRRRVAVSLDYLPYYDSYQLTATVRIAFVHFDAKSVGVLYNLAV